MKWNLSRYSIGVKGHPTPQYLCRDEALFVDCEWYWSEDRDKAHHFLSLQEADGARTQHACKDEKGEDYLLFSVPVTPRDVPRAAAEPSTQWDRHSPEEVFRETERRLGERHERRGHE